MPDAIRWYDQNVSDVSRRYESVAAETVHGWLVDLLPNAPALVLDIGAGTGRDAAWLASRGLEVVAVEPSGAMRAEAQRLHPSRSIRRGAVRKHDATNLNLISNAYAYHLRAF